MHYGLYSKIEAKAGKRDDVVEILLRDVEKLADAGCQSYIVNLPKDEPNAIWITEIWTSPKAHQASIELPSVKQAIGDAMPMLTGKFHKIELNVLGGLGLD